MKILNDIYIPVVIIGVLAIAYSAYLSYDIRSRSEAPINKTEDPINKKQD
jgi:Tfp pilus assembly protein PilE